MARPGIIVCEKSNVWAVSLRWALIHHDVRVYETRTLADAWQQLVSSPASLLALELRENSLEQTVRLLVQQRREFPHAATMILASREQQDWEWILREAGAIHVAVSQRNLEPLMRLASCFLGRPTCMSSSFEETVWDQLPWR